MNDFTALLLHRRFLTIVGITAAFWGVSLPRTRAQSVFARLEKAPEPPRLASGIPLTHF